MNKEELTPEEKELFNTAFYQNEKRVWMSKDGESYGSERPEMLKGELFRVIAKIAQSREQALIKKIEEIEPYTQNNPNMTTEYQYYCEGYREMKERILQSLKDNK